MITSLRPIQPPDQHEQLFIITAHHILHGQTTSASQLDPDHLLPSQFRLYAEFLLEVRPQQGGNVPFWNVYDALCRDLPRLYDFSHCLNLSDPLSAFSLAPFDFCGTPLSTVTPRPLHWLWPGYLPLGKLTLLEGACSVGKSIFLRDLAARISRGDTLPDGSPGLAQPSSVVLIMGEDGLEDTIIPDLATAHADLSRILSLANIPFTLPSGAPTTRPFTLTLDLPVLERTLLASQAKLLIIDPLSRVLGGKQPDKESDLATLLFPLSELCQRLQVACILVHRLTGSTPAALARTSLASTGLTRLSWLLERDAEQPQICVLRQLHNHLQEPAPTLHFTIITQMAPDGPHPSLCWLDSDPYPTSLASTDTPPTTRQAILDILHNSAQALSIQQLHDALPNITRNSIRVTLNRLLKDRQINRYAHDAYIAPPAASPG